MKAHQNTSVDEYIAAFPEEIKICLEQMRNIILSAAPEAVESISWQMPAYKLRGKPLVYFAAHRGHIGFYPIPSGIEAFSDELSAYKTGKGTAQFPYSKALPVDLIERIVKYRINEINSELSIPKNKTT